MRNASSQAGLPGPDESETQVGPSEPCSISPPGILRSAQAWGPPERPQKPPILPHRPIHTRVSRGGQWLRLRAPSAGGPGLIPGQETRCHTPQLRVPKPQLKSLRAKTKLEDPARRNQDLAQSNKINESFKKKKKSRWELHYVEDCACSTWDRNSPARDLVSVLVLESGVLPTGPPGTSLCCLGYGFSRRPRALAPQELQTGTL